MRGMSRGLPYRKLLSALPVVWVLRRYHVPDRTTAGKDSWADGTVPPCADVLPSARAGTKVPSAKPKATKVLPLFVRHLDTVFPLFACRLALGVNLAANSRV
jgi:hypothetical protein